MMSSNSGHFSCRLFCKEHGSKVLDVQGLYHEMSSNSETGRRRVSLHPSQSMMNSAVGEKDVVVSAWFVGAQQGDSVSDSTQYRCLSAVSVK